MYLFINTYNREKQMGHLGPINQLPFQKFGRYALCMHIFYYYIHRNTFFIGIIDRMNRKYYNNHSKHGDIARAFLNHLDLCLKR